MSDFERCLPVVLGAEGGYSNHPNDRGGKTNMGITEGTLSNAYSKGIVSHKDVKKLTRDEAAKIYQTLYWQPSGAGQIPWPLCLLHFDAAVNCGVDAAGKQLQRTINSIKGPVLKVDGAVGPATLAAIKDMETKFLCLELLKTRRKYHETIVKNNPSQKVFLDGWLNRIDKLKKYI